MARTRAKRRQSADLTKAATLVALGCAGLVVTILGGRTPTANSYQAIGTLGIIALGAAVMASRQLWLPVLRWAWRRRQRTSVVAPATGRPPQPVATSREPIPAGLRFAVLRRDGFRCAYCGRGQDQGVRLHIDHLMPVARGGRNEIDNLVTACADCNLGKGAQDLVGPA